MVTGRTAVLLAVGAPVVVLAPQYGTSPWIAMLAVLALTTVLVGVDWVLTPDPRRITVRREGADRVRLGESATVQVRLDNHSGSHADLLVRDAWTPSAGSRPYSQRVVLAAGEGRTLATSLTPTRRGDRIAAPVTVRGYGPLRLAFRQADHEAGWRLRVLPPFTARKHLPEKLAKLRVIEGSTTVRGRTQGTEFDSLREYVPGDDVRSIDWRATARRQEVMLRTWRPERSRRVVCVLDTGRTSAVRVGDEPRLDSAIDAALLLAAVAQEAGDQVDLIAADHRVRGAVTGSHGRNLLPRLVDVLAPLHPALTETDFELITSEILRRERKRSLVVLFTALEPGALGEGLLPVLPRLAARHKVLIAAVHNPTLNEMATTPLDSTAAIYTAAAGNRALEERTRIAAALSRNSVTVLDCPADTFASQVTDAYLALKAAGQL